MCAMIPKMEHLSFNVLSMPVYRCSRFTLVTDTEVKLKCTVRTIWKQQQQKPCVWGLQEPGSTQLSYQLDVKVPIRPLQDPYPHCVVKSWNWQNHFSFPILRWFSPIFSGTYSFMIAFILSMWSLVVSQCHQINSAPFPSLVYLCEWNPPYVSELFLKRLALWWKRKYQKWLQ